jgi:hypothetical protein
MTTEKTTMTVYNYHPVSGQFTGASEAEPSPMSPGEFLIPAYATDVAPPEACSEGCALAWSNISKAWGEIPDHRGEVWYGKEGDAFTIRLAGDPARQGLLPKAPERAAEPLGAPEIPLMRYALVGDGKVIQIIEGYNLVWKVAENTEMVEAPKSLADVFIGSLYEEGTFKMPPVVDESEAGEVFPAKAGASR